MNERRLPRGSVAQAVYTWSRTLINGKQGMGFAAISPSLVGSIDWLLQIDPSEFSLFQGEVTGVDSSLYEARKGFSEVGRMFVDDVAIVYRKTADGLVSQTPDRPHQVVHALLAEPATLGLSTVTRIRDEIWIRQVKGSAGGLPLTDLALADVLDETATTGHSCSADHEQAAQLLAVVAEMGFEDEGTIELAGGDDVLAAVALAFPPEVANRCSLTPYVAIGGVQRELVLRLPGKTESAEALRQASGNGKYSTAYRRDECPFERAVRQAASEILYGAKPSLSQYAASAVRLSKAPTAGAGRPGADLKGSAPIAEVNPVYRLLEEASPETAPLTDAESKAFLSTLLASGISAEQVLSLPQGTQIQMFAKVADGEVLREWSRQLFADVGTEAFINLWNKTRIGAFLGIVLIKNLTTAEGEGIKISGDQGVEPDVTAAILRSMRRYPDSGRNIGRVIKRGFGDTESMRQFIAETFAEYPRFLFDAILESADVPPAQVADYIRCCYEPWAAHRKLPEWESAAIEHALRQTFLQRLKAKIGRQ